MVFAVLVLQSQDDEAALTFDAGLQLAVGVSVEPRRPGVPPRGLQPDLGRHVLEALTP